MYQYGHVDVLQLKEILGHENLATLKFILMLSTNNCAVPLTPTRLIKSKSTAKSLNLILMKLKAEQPAKKSACGGVGYSGKNYKNAYYQKRIQ